MIGIPVDITIFMGKLRFKPVDGMGYLFQV